MCLRGDNPGFLRLHGALDVGLFSVYVQGDGLEAAAEAAFVRQSFNWRAFLFGPAWLVFNRLWAGLAVWIIAYIFLLACAATIVSAGASLLIALAVQVLLGLEASALSEAKLGRQGYRLAGIITAPALEAAESRFYRHAERRAGAPGTRTSDLEAGKDL